MFKNDDQLFAVCLEMKSQVGKKDENMELDVLTLKFAEFEKQLSKFSKFTLFS